MTSFLHSRNFSLACLLLLTLTGFFLRIHDLGAVPLRGDEAFSAEYWAGLPFTESLTRIATIEPHPPLTYVIFSAWGSLVSIRNEFALRFLPAIINLLGIPAMYVLGKRLFGERGGLLAAFVWAIHPFEIWHARDFRNYAIWGALSIFTLYFSWQAITQNTRKSYIFYFTIALFTCLTFYFELFTVVAVALWGIVVLIDFPSPLGEGLRVRLRGWLFLNAIIISLTVLTFIVLQGHLFGSGGYGGNTAAFNLSSLLTIFPSTFVFGETLPENNTAILSLVVLIFAGVSLWVLRKQHKKSLFLLCLLVIPIALLVLVSVRVSVFTPRYVMVAVVPLTLVFVGGSSQLFKRHTLIRFATVAVWILAIFVISFSINNLFNSVDYRKSFDWYTVRDYFTEHLQADDIIVQTTVDASIGYYINPLTLTAAIPSTPNQTSEDIDQSLHSLTENTSTVWLYEHSYYPWANAKVARQWFDTHWQAVTQTTLLGSPLTRYMPFEVSLVELTPKLDIFFEEVALLRSFHIEQTSQDMTVWLYWQPPTTDAYNVSVQLIGDLNPQTGNPIWVQSDLPLPASAIQTRDVRLIRLANVPSGNYSLILKVYDPANNEIVLAGSQEYYKLEEITISH